MLPQWSKQAGPPRTRDRPAKRNLGYCSALTWSVRGGGAVGQPSSLGKRELERDLYQGHQEDVSGILYLPYPLYFRGFFSFCFAFSSFSEVRDYIPHPLLKTLFLQPWWTWMWEVMMWGTVLGKEHWISPYFCISLGPILVFITRQPHRC